MKQITFTVTVPDEAQLGLLLTSHPELLEVLATNVARVLSLNIADVSASVEATVPVVNPRRLGVITGIVP
jgi:hypothetical protein